MKKKVMKKGILFLPMMIVLVMTLVSADYSCSEGDFVEDQDEIDLGERETINWLGLGLIASDETAALNKYSADLITDAKEFTLTNDTSSIEIEFKSGTQNVSLVNATDSTAKISVGGSSELGDEGDVMTVGSFKVFLTSTEGVYPGIATVKGIIGVEKISLSSDDLFEIVTLDSVDYLLELFSASDDNAIVKVKKCDNESADIVEVGEVVEEEVDNSTVENVTVINETLENVSLEGVGESNESLDVVSESADVEDETASVSIGDAGFLENRTYIIIFSVVIGISFGVFIILYFKNKFGKRGQVESVVRVTGS